MKYKMKCHACGRDAVYVPDHRFEALGWITVKCVSDDCYCKDHEYFVPIDNPELEKIEEL